MRVLSLAPMDHQMTHIQPGAHWEFANWQREKKIMTAPLRQMEKLSSNAYCIIEASRISNQWFPFRINNARIPSRTRPFHTLHTFSIQSWRKVRAAGCPVNNKEDNDRRHCKSYVRWMYRSLDHLVKHTLEIPDRDSSSTRRTNDLLKLRLWISIIQLCRAFFFFSFLHFNLILIDCLNPAVNSTLWGELNNSSSQRYEYPDIFKSRKITD